jgi:hypothetical protein
MQPVALVQRWRIQGGRSQFFCRPYLGPVNNGLHALHVFAVAAPAAAASPHTVLTPAARSCSPLPRASQRSFPHTAMQKLRIVTLGCLAWRDRKWSLNGDKSQTFTSYVYM